MQASTEKESRMDDIDLCPLWWPWPFRHHFGVSVEGPHPEPWKEIPHGGQISLQLFRALTVYNMGYRYHDKEGQAQIQRLAIGQVRELTAKLQPAEAASTRGGRSFDDIDLCPPWWPWPWPHRNLGNPVGGPTPEPWKEIPSGGQISLQMFRALTIYNMGFQYHDGEAQARIQELAVKQLNELAGNLQNVENA
jgi:hypothetical protein